MVHALESITVSESARRDEEGVVLVLLALIVVALFLFAAFAIDAANARQQRRQAQNAADASSLAATDALPDVNAAVAAAKTYAWSNFGVDKGTGWNGCTDTNALPYQPDAGDACISFDAATNPTQVRVRIPIRHVPTFLAVVAGFSSMQVSASAVAQRQQAGKCALCILGPTGQTLTGTGNGNVTVTGGSVVVNSTGGPAAKLTGNASVSGQTIGGPAAPAGFATTGHGAFIPVPIDEAPVPDPLAGIPSCPMAAPCAALTTQPDVHVSGGGSQTINPGIYGSISVSGNGAITLNPGVYVITHELKATGNGPLVARGVTIYLACPGYPTPCSPNTNGATYAVTGNGSLDVTPPTSGPFAGLSVFSDRNNSGTLAVTGNGDTFSGTLYAKSGSLVLTGNGSGLFLNSMVVVHDATTTGNGSIGITYNGSNTPPNAGGAVLIA